MKILNKVLIFVLVTALVMALTACGVVDKSSPESTISTSSSVEQPEPSKEESVETPAPSQESTPPVVESDFHSDKLAEMMSGTDSGYVVETKTFEDGEISIKYPFITGYEHISAHEKINSIIKDYVDDFVAKNTVEDTKPLIEAEYEIKFINDRLISIVFVGYGNFEGAAHPWNIFNTLNIDVLGQKQLVLSDFFTVDEKLFDHLLKYPVSTDKELAEQGVASLIENKESNLEWFSETDKGNLNFSYFTSDKVGVSLWMINALGGHMEFEFPI